MLIFDHFIAVMPCINLHKVRDQLVGRFGKEFAEAALNNRMGLVNPRVRTYISILISFFRRLRMYSIPKLFRLGFRV
jgi:hypothetical protein